MVLEQLDIHMQKKKKKSRYRLLGMEIRIPFTGINSKWITDPNIKHKITKFLEDRQSCG